jgi:hypothetical protein
MGYGENLHSKELIKKMSLMKFNVVMFALFVNNC